MKKTVAIFLMLVLLAVSFSGCANETNQTKNYEIWKLPFFDQPDPYQKPSYKDHDKHSDIGDVVYEDDVKKSIVVDILGNSYEVQYEFTRTDNDGTTYEYVTEHGGQVQINAETGKIEIYKVPYDFTAKTEKEYIDHIQNTILSEYDLSGYTVSCKTSALAWEKMYDGFKLCSEEDGWKQYVFTFQKQFSGIDAWDSFRVIFEAKGNVLVETDNYRGYTEQDFAGILSEIDAIEADVCNQFLRTDIAEGYSLVRIGEPTNYRLYVLDGVPYLDMYVTVDFTAPNYEDPISTPVRILVKYIG